MTTTTQPIITMPTIKQTVEVVVKMTVNLYTNMTKQEAEQYTLLNVKNELQDRGIEYDAVSTVAGFQEDEEERAADLAYELFSDQVFCGIQR